MLLQCSIDIKEQFDPVDLFFSIIYIFIDINND